ncbi:MAG: response regulator transcription factor [Dictyoglomus sp.]|uniref:response regulator transcription factor n=1 Tax=Dictyoglomus sp. TaxID=28205 RepID=UPI003D0F4FD8
MYKVFIADDEYYIREGLKRIVNWERLGFKIVGEAEDGIEALEKIKRINPDLCVIDVKMPEMDGLELISNIKSYKNSTKIIILTGYPEFDYAIKAIELGVNFYILKPVDPEILKEKLEKVYHELEKERILYESSKGRIMERFLKKHLDVKEDEINNIFCLDLPWNSYQVVLVDWEDKSLDKIKVLEDISYYFPFSFLVDNFIGFVIKDFSKEKRKLINLRDHLRNKYRDYFCFSIGEKVYDFLSISSSFEKAKSLFSRRFLYEEKGFLVYPKGKKNLKPHLELEKINNVALWVEVIEDLDFVKLWELLEDKMIKHMVYEDEEQEIKLSYFNLYVDIVTLLITRYSQFKEKSFKYLKNRIFEEFFNKRTIIDLHVFTKEILTELISDFSEIMGRNPLVKITEYIESNFYKDLKLKDVAKEFGYNPCYLGKIFKKYTKEKFNTYLDRVRINKAKELLRRGLKVSEVAEMVGYKDTDYFICKFKKYTGKSPQNFKESI